MITVLPCRVKLLQFPKSHLPHVTYAIVKTCFFQDTKDPYYFFSFTENSSEISIITSQEIIEDEFIPYLTTCQCRDLNVSSDSYRILQVDDEDSNGKHIYDLSGTLAQGKFSILYMSTYQTDFVLIKETSLQKAVQLLQHHQFEFDMDSVEQDLSEEEPFESGETCCLLQDLEQTVLLDEFYCVGLNPHYQSEWAMTVLKVLSYPELSSQELNEARFLSFTLSSEGISLIANQFVLDLFEQGSLFQDEEDHYAYRVIQVNFDLETSGIFSHPLATEAHIDNLLYLSTFKSANVLVPSKELIRAEEIVADDLKHINNTFAEVVLEMSL